MTTTATALATPTRPRRTGTLQGLVRATLRLHRSALWFWLMLVAVAAGALLWNYGYALDAAFAEFTRAGCHDGGVQRACEYSVSDYHHLGTADSVGRRLTGLVPLLTAAWAGSALIGRELEKGTAQLLWTQSVSPARWLAAQLAVPAALLVTGTGLLTLLHRLMWDKHSQLWGPLGSWQWHQSGGYFANGTLATAYALLGLAVGALAGMFVQRSLRALVVASAALLALMTFLGELRPHLWPVETLTRKGGYPEWTGMVVRDGVITSSGSHVPDPYCNDDKCRAAADIVGYFRDYHPASHFWPLQLMETGVVLALTAAAAAASFWLLRRRTV
ncbi:ABC transporter permease [Streptomyces sp. SID12501]|uniref:ABC transporter permease n=1 Tax=Streptomyces sp. SID12501 TaxID=2706042 RepID=A0A6B3C3Y7_9ACTN|nr:ABC transporter permease [Streptomyces sp. SID12501]NEC90950.1 ABC transporter permease [Streptomyces sp. SID12501]